MEQTSVTAPAGSNERARYDFFFMPGSGTTRPTSSRLVLRIHPLCIKNMARRIAELEAVVGEFNLNFTEQIGFDGAFRFLGQAGGFLQYEIPLPSAAEDSGSKQAAAVCASLAVILAVLKAMDHPAPPTPPEHFVLELVTVGESDFVLYGSCGPELAEYLRAYQSVIRYEATCAIADSWRRLRGDNTRLPQGDGFAWIEDDGMLRIRCTESAILLGPDEKVARTDGGYHFRSCRMKSPGQVLMLLAAIAALARAARIRLHQI
jgi:hypothetical protein